MSMMRFLAPSQISALGDDEVTVIMSTSARARDGHVLVPQGGLLDNYRRNPVVLWSHNTDEPVGNAEDVKAGAAQISARVRFAPLGIARKADEVRGLTKAGIIRATSIGFDAIEMEPLDPKRPRGGMRITKWELLELSFVSVPSDTGAIVTARAQREGKALSGANAAALQAAHDHAEQCRDTIANVLGGDGARAGNASQDRDYHQRQLAVRKMAQDPETEWRSRQVMLLDTAGVPMAKINRIKWNSTHEHIKRQIQVLLLEVKGRS